MKILVIGSGGREHAIVWKLAQSPKATQIWCAPGNAGIATERVHSTGNPVECVELSATDTDGLLTFAQENAVDLTVVGPEAPLVAGLVDAFAEAGLRAWGPNQKAAAFEGSKVISQEFMERHNIPTMKAGCFQSVDEAKSFAEDLNGKVVIKADGLAAGKGVLICDSIPQALKAIDQVMVTKDFGDAGNQVVVQEFLEGTEVSIHALLDGRTAIAFPSSQDHKRAYDNDEGLNTGGMGAYSPAPFLPPEEFERVARRVLDPFLEGCKKDGIDYRGVLYPGIMLTEAGPKVLEFNVRFGDPETQVYLTRMENDLIDLIEACLDGTLDQQTITWAKNTSVCVVMAANGYPGHYPKGDPITGLESADGESVKVFHAGTTTARDQIVTNGGRVLGVTSWASELTQAQTAAYAAVAKIAFNAHYRRDIGNKALITDR